MAYVNQEDKKVIKAALDKVLKPLGIKFSLKIQHHSKISLTLRSGSIDFVEDYIQSAYSKDPDCLNVDQLEYMKTNNYMQVNHYWHTDLFSTKVSGIIGQIVQAMKSANWYDKSDAMVDYFDTAYYFDISVGYWDKPYQLTV